MLRWHGWHPPIWVVSAGIKLCQPEHMRKAVARCGNRADCRYSQSVGSLLQAEPGALSAAQLATRYTSDDLRHALPYSCGISPPRLAVDQLTHLTNSLSGVRPPRPE